MDLLLLQSQKCARFDLGGDDADAEEAQDQNLVEEGEASLFDLEAEVWYQR